MALAFQSSTLHSKRPQLALHGQRRQPLQQRLAQARAAVGRLHVQVFQVDARLAQEGGEVGEEQRKGHDLTLHFAHQGFGHGA
jgi:hypothetical protein